jgi:hypothetical protein
MWHIIVPVSYLLVLHRIVCTSNVSNINNEKRWFIIVPVPYLLVLHRIVCTSNVININNEKRWYIIVPVPYKGLKGENSLCCITDVVPINERMRILIRFETTEAFKSMRIVLRMKYYSRLHWEVLLNAEFIRYGPDFAVRVATLYDFVITLKYLMVSWRIL